MAKQKIVIKLTMPNAKSRAEAMALAAKQSGVRSVGITGDDRLEVGGEGIDVVCLVNRLRENPYGLKCLRKKFCHAEIVTVEEVKEKTPEEKKKEEEKKKKEAEEKKKKEAEEKKKKEEPKPCLCPPGPCRCAGYYPTPMLLCEQEPGCHIM